MSCLICGSHYALKCKHCGHSFCEKCDGFHNMIVYSHSGIQTRMD